MTKVNADPSAEETPIVAALVERARRLDGPRADRHRAFGALVARFQDMAFGCSFALLGDYQGAEDAAQEAFFTAYQNLGQLRDAAAFPGWLRQIVRTQCHRKIRRSEFPVAPYGATDVVENGTQLSAGGDPEAEALRRERQRQVRATLAALPERERMVTILFYVREYSRAEVAQFLGISVVAVKKRLAAARAHFRESWVQMVQDDLREQRPSNSPVFATRLMAFTKLFSAFVDEGRSLVRSLKDLADAEDDPAFRAAIEDVNLELQSGNILSRAMAKHPAYFSPEYIAAIHEGEVGGNLDIILCQLANGTYEEDDKVIP